MTPSILKALLLKELHHHGFAFVGTAVLLAALQATALTFTLTSEVDTLLSASTGFSYYAMPFAIAYVVRRLVVIEHEDHTHDFLAALPATALARVSVKFAVSLVFTWSATLLSLGFVAALVVRQEIIGLGWLMQVTWQVCAYTFAWLGLSFGAAHLGRYRFSFWLCLMPLVFTLDLLWPDVWSWGLWHAVLAESVDVTRYLPPVDRLAVSMAWGTVGTAVGFALGTFRSGSVADAWYRPMTSREKAMLIVGVVGVWMALDIVDSVVVPGDPSYSGVEAVDVESVVVRVAANRDSDLWKTGEDLAESLAGFGETLGLQGWPTVVLVSNPQRPQDAVTLRSNAHDELVLEVDADARRAVILRDCFEAAIGERTHWFPWWRSGRLWIATGAPLWWLGPDPERPESFALRAGYAVSMGITAEDLADGHALRYRFGPDVAAGIGWAGLQTVEDLAGRDAAEALVARALEDRPSDTLLGSIRADLRSGDRMLRKATGLEPEAFRRAWYDTLRRHHEAHRETLEALMPGWGTLQRTEGLESDVVLAWTWPGPLPSEAQVEWIQLDPLQQLPVLGQPYEDREIFSHEGRIPTRVDPRARVATSFRVEVDALDGILYSGFQVDP